MVMYESGSYVIETVRLKQGVRPKGAAAYSRFYHMKIS
jgi:hypothetical protein